MYKIIFISLLVLQAVSHLKILEPESLIVDNGNKKGTPLYSIQLITKDIDAVTTTFGYVPYGQNIVGTVIYPIPHNGCDPFNMENEHLEIDNDIIILVDRGTCSFATKVYYGELAGAQLVIINDYESETMNQDIVMVDDQNNVGKDVTIPSMMVDYTKGKKILDIICPNVTNCTKDAGVVTLMADFEFPTSNVVEYSVWMSSDSFQSYFVLTEFKEYHELLANHVKFTPHFVLWYSPQASLKQWAEEDENCLSGGRYCAPDPDGFGPLTGRKIVEEDLNQLCVFQEYPEKYYSYVEEYVVHCFSNIGNIFSGETKQGDCFRGTIQHDLGIDAQRINDCVFKSFYSKTSYNEAMDDNSLLEAERTAYLQNGTAIWPSFLINGMQYKGNLDAHNLFEAICTSFNPEDLPQACQNHQVVDEENSKVDVVHDKSNIKLTVIVFVLLAFFLLFAYVFYKRKIRRELNEEMMNQVNQAVAQYYQMQSQNRITQKETEDQHVKLNV